MNKSIINKENNFTFFLIIEDTMTEYKSRHFKYKKLRNYFQFLTKPSQVTRNVRASTKMTMFTFIFKTELIFTQNGLI
jgi:hypothetical protein